jgi:hypothetical protein
MKCRTVQRIIYVCSLRGRWVGIRLQRFQEMCPTLEKKEKIGKRKKKKKTRPV